MTSRITFVAALGAAVLAAAPASASSSAWFEAEGARIRLVSAGQPDAAGNLRGVLDVELKPGWKTYWRDPGNSGVPPHIGISSSRNIAAAEFSFPAPQFHDDGYGKWAGYDHPVRFPVTFAVTSPDQPSLIAADIFIGICESICVPLQAKLELDPASDPDNAEHVALVSAAFAALPAPAGPDFNAELAPGTGDQISVVATSPGDPETLELFIASADDYVFGTPRRHVEDGKAVFTIKLLERPDVSPAGRGIRYTLAGQAGAVDGFLPYP